MPDELQKEPASKIIDEAKKRFAYASSWESNARKNWIEDYKFANGDSENLWQWEHQDYASRSQDQLPTLTINKVRQHNLLIINDAKQNKPSVRYRPVSDDASKDAAEVLEGIVRHIEYQSKAQVAYDTATAFQVQAGLGALRVTTRYADDHTFDQEIYIERVRDPLTILWDPDAQEADYSDARYCFVYDDVPRDEFNLLYPEFKGQNPPSTFSDNGEEWISNDHVRVAEYWRKEEIEDELLMMRDPNTGAVSYAYRSSAPASLVNEVEQDPTTRTRKVTRSVIQHFILIGDQVAKREAWAGIYIPIVPVIGEEVIIEGVMDRKGHTRAMRDVQRMFNVMYSESIAQIAAQARSPWTAPAEAIEGYETYWESANTSMAAVLPYNAYDDQGNKLPPPERTPPQVAAPAYIQGMQIATQEIMAVSGQYEAQQGRPGNEKSGKAIQERQRQGDTATYHYIDNLAVAIRQVGRIILDLIPKIYDQPRILRILNIDGTERQIKIDPNAQKAYQKVEETKDAVAEVFNPNVGKYDVQADIGPNYASAREEAWNALSQIAIGAPQIMQIAGDLIFRAADFPMSDELAERFKNIIPPSVTGDAPPPAIQQMIQQGQQIIQQQQQQIADLQAKLQGAAQALQQRELQLTERDQDNLVDIYKAETDRLKVLIPDKKAVPGPMVDPHQIALMAAQLILDMAKMPIGEVSNKALQDLSNDPGSFGHQVSPMGQALAQPGGMQPQMPQQSVRPAPNQYPQDAGIPSGSKISADGSIPVPDPNNPGNYLQAR